MIKFEVRVNDPESEMVATEIVEADDVTFDETGTIRFWRTDPQTKMDHFVVAYAAGYWVRIANTDRVLEIKEQ